MSWIVHLSTRAIKQMAKLPESVKASLIALIREIEASGPVRGNWPNYGKLGPDMHHCHLKKGKTTYVAVWQVVDKRLTIVEIRYVGTHENAPY